jgi:hypothetical protein
MKKRLILVALACLLPLRAQVKFNKTDTQIEIVVDGKPFSTLFFGPETPKPYMHPLRSASGKSVTRGYPMLNIPSETHDHPHHRGLWFTHGEVNGMDFWANEPGEKSGPPIKGKVVLNKVLEVKGGAKAGTIKMAYDWKTPEGKLVLAETRTTTVYSDPKLRIMDFDVEWKAAEKVLFGDTKEGTFAIRLATPLQEPQKNDKPEQAKATGKMVAADGRTGEAQVWGKRSPWLDYWGMLEGEKLGIAIFDHPGNPKHPTYWHTRSYGLFAANIFGEHDFYNDPKRNGSITLQPGKTLRFRYRVVIHPGDTQEANIAGLYKKYTEENAH